MPAQASNYFIRVRVLSSNTSMGTVTLGGGNHDSNVYVCGTSGFVSRFNAEASPASDSYMFSGWTYEVVWQETPPSGSSASVVFGSANLAKTTIYGSALWALPSQPYSSTQMVSLVVTANFTNKPSYTITVKSNNDNWGTVRPTSATYYVGHSFEIRADAKTGYHFTEWDDQNTNSTRTITVTGPRTYIANFAANTYTVSLLQNGGSSGTASVTATYGMALPNITIPKRTGYDFQGYFDVEKPTDNNPGVRYYNANGTSARNWDKTSNTNLYARWERKKCTLTLVADPNTYGKVTRKPSIQLWYGDEVTITATPTQPWYKFTRWADSGDGHTSATRTIKMKGDHTYTAYFEENQSYSFGDYRVQVVAKSNNNNRGHAYIYTEAGSSQDVSAIYSPYTAITLGGVEATATIGRLEARPNPGYEFNGWVRKHTYAPKPNSGNPVTDPTVRNYDPDKAINQNVDVSSTMVALPELSGDYGTGSSSGNLVTVTFTAQFVKSTYDCVLNVYNNQTTMGEFQIDGTSYSESEAVEYYASGTSVELKAIPYTNSGCKFVSWKDMESGEILATTKKYTVKLVGSGDPSNPSVRKILATFMADPNYVYKTSLDGTTNAGYYVKVRPFVKDGQSEYGSVKVTNTYYNEDTNSYGKTIVYRNITNGGIPYPTQKAKITATPNPGYSFVKWKYDADTMLSHSTWGENSDAVLKIDGKTESKGSLIITKDSAVAVTSNTEASVVFCGTHTMAGLYKTNECVQFDVEAEFKMNELKPVSVTKNKNLGTVSGAGSYPYGSVVTVTATPNQGATVSGYQRWQDGVLVDEVSTSSQQYTFTVPEATDNITVKVIFAVIKLGQYRVKCSVLTENSNKGSVSVVGNSPNVLYKYSDYKDITILGVQATVPQFTTVVTPATGWVFSEWEQELVDVLPTDWDSTKSTWSISSEFTPNSTNPNSYDINAGAKFVALQAENYPSDEEVHLRLTAKFESINPDHPPYALLVKAVSGGGGTVAGDIYKTQLKEIGNYQTLSDMPFSATPNAGYHFVIWTQDTPVYDMPDGVGGASSFSTTYSPNATSSSVTVTTTGRWTKVANYDYGQDQHSVSISIRANFAPNTYTVTFDRNGGSGGTSSTTATYGSAMPSITPPTRSGYLFLGYFDKKNGGTQYYDENGASANNWNKTSNTTLYAQWSKDGIPIKVYKSSGWKTCSIKVYKGAETGWVECSLRKAQSTSGDWT